MFYRYQRQAVAECTSLMPQLRLLVDSMAVMILGATSVTLWWVTMFLSTVTFHLGNQEKIRKVLEYGDSRPLVTMQPSLEPVS